jgi:hypothetical protein
MTGLSRADVLPTCGFQVGRELTDPCGRPAHYAFEIDRDHWSKEDARVPTRKPLIGYACLFHGGEARKMPAVFNIRTIA